MQEKPYVTWKIKDIYYLTIYRKKNVCQLLFLKLNIQKAKIMVSGPITSWQIDGETMETVTDFILQTATAAMKLKDACSLEETLWPT